MKTKERSPPAARRVHECVASLADKLSMLTGIKKDDIVGNWTHYLDWDEYEEF